MNEKHKVSHILEDINESVYSLCSEILKLGIKRALKIFTFLLNIVIWMVYFPATIVQIREKNIKKSDNEFKPIEKNFERIYGLYLLILLNFNNIKEFNTGETDQKIDNLICDSNQKLIENFFLYNTLPPDFSLANYKFRIEHKVLPDLSFDPEYQKIMDSEAAKHLYFFLREGVIFSRNNYHIFKYIPEKEILTEYFEMFERGNPQILMNINPNLGFSHQMTNFTLNIGIPIFGSERFINLY